MNIQNKKYVIANWKSHKDITEARKWLAVFNREVLPDGVEVVVCPAYPLLKAFEGVPFKLGVQDISQFEEGPHTGEVASEQVANLVEYTIVGHSERRKEFNETDEVVVEKIKKALEQDLTPVVCVSNLDQVRYLRQLNLHEDRFVLAFEPLEAISTNKDSHVYEAEAVLEFIDQVRAIYKAVPIVYGGSVDPKNVLDFVKSPEIAGVLVGQASLDPKKFLEITNLYAVR